MTTQTRTDTQASTRPSDRRIDYSFDAVPKQARELLEQGQISRTDYAVLIELLKFQKAFRGSCWTTKSRSPRRSASPPRPSSGPTGHSPMPA